MQAPKITFVIPALAFSLASAAQPNWRQVQPAVSPSERWAHAMCYDLVRSRAVLFGGLGSTEYADTWEWDGKLWSPRFWLKPFPPKRYDHAMAYDHARRKTVLFGGRLLSGPRFADTWEYDGMTWSQIKTASSPPARAGHTMAFDSIRKKVVLFGGYTSQQRLADTWEYDGRNWTWIAPSTSPLARNAHAMAYDAARGKLVLFGGYTGQRQLNDTWEYDGKTWFKKKTATVPPARYGAAMAYDRVRRRIVLFGGYNGRYLSDTWEYDGKNWVQSKTRLSPPGLQNSAMVYAFGPRQILLFGGNLGPHRYAGTWTYSDPNAGYRPYGSGCGTPPATLQAKQGTWPRIGRRLSANLVSLPRTSSVAVMSIGASKAKLGAFPLPIDLTPFGMPGCKLYSSIDVTYRLAVASGKGTFALPIPNDERLIGVPAYLQALVVALQANAGGVLTTNGLAIRISN